MGWVWLEAKAGEERGGQGWGREAVVKMAKDGIGGEREKRRANGGIESK